MNTRDDLISGRGEPVIWVTGTARPRREEKLACIELVTRLADDGWHTTAATDEPIGVLVERSAKAVGGTFVPLPVGKEDIGDSEHGEVPVWAPAVLREACAASECTLFLLHTKERILLRVSLCGGVMGPRSRAADRARVASWWTDHPTYRREYREKNRESIREKNREVERRRRQRRKTLKAGAQGDRERAREYHVRVKAEDPGRLRGKWEKERREHPERIRARQRAYYQRNRETVLARTRARADANPEKKRDEGRKWRDANPDRVTAYRKARREDEQAYRKMLEQNRDAKRLNSKLRRAGLPPKQVHPATAAERRRNQLAADQFFQRPRTMEERRQILTDVEATPPELLQQWATSAAAVRRRAEDVLRFKRAVNTYTATHRGRLRGEAELDSRARQLRGKEPLDIDQEVKRRAIQAIRGAWSPNPSTSTANTGLPQRAFRPVADPGAGPHTAPGAGRGVGMT